MELYVMKREDRIRAITSPPRIFWKTRKLLPVNNNRQHWLNTAYETIRNLAESYFFFITGAKVQKKMVWATLFKCFFARACAKKWEKRFLNRKVILKHFYNTMPSMAATATGRGWKNSCKRVLERSKNTLSSIYDLWLLRIGETSTQIAPLIVSYRSIRIMRFTTAERLPSVTIHAYQDQTTHSFPEKTREVN